MDHWFVRRLVKIIRYDHQSRDQVLSSGRILRKDLDEISVGIAVGKLKYILAGRQRMPRNLYWRAKLELCSLVPFIGQQRPRHKRRQRQKAGEAECCQSR